MAHRFTSKDSEGESQGHLIVIKVRLIADVCREEGESARYCWTRRRGLWNGKRQQTRSVRTDLF